MSHLSEAIIWRRAFNFPTPNPGAELYHLGLITEEFHELTESVLDKLGDSHTLKELADLVFTCFQLAAAKGWDLDKALTRVFDSNMSKLGADGQPILREDGKVLKGPNYQEPNLEDLVS